MNPPKADPAVSLAEVSRLLYDEADCLDRADLDAWADLYTDDGVYWMPAAPGQTDSDTHISLVYDDRLMMELRRRNFGHRFSASMAYPVRCSHLIGNVRLGAGDDHAPDIVATSNFQAVVFYRETQTLYAGRYTHRLARVDGALKIAHKRVDLLNADAEHGNLVIYL